jgi:hypothetical protein
MLAFPSEGGDMTATGPRVPRHHDEGRPHAVELFGLPLPLPARTLYHALGLGPDATTDELRWSSSEAAERLQREESRLAYDRAHPPLALLKLEDCADELLTDERTCMFLLRLAISEFLAAKHEPVLHPSDLTRRDFSDELTFNPVLDGGG